MSADESYFPSVDYDLPIPQDNEDLNDEITRLAGHINAATYRFLKLLAEQIRRKSWSAGGEVKSPAHWLNYRCGITIGAAREKVRVAERLGSLPMIDNAFKSGALSYSKVRAMVRVATPENEDFLLQIARYGTASHMEKLVRKYQWVERLNGEDHAATQQEARCFNWYYDGDGMVIFHGKIPAASGTVVVKALQVAYDAIHNRLTAGEKKLASLPVEFPVVARDTVREDEGDVHAAHPDETTAETTPRSCRTEIEPNTESDDERRSSDAENDSAETFAPSDGDLRDCGPEDDSAETFVQSDCDLGDCGPVDDSAETFAPSDGDLGDCGPEDDSAETFAQSDGDLGDCGPEDDSAETFAQSDGDLGDCGPVDDSAETFVHTGSLDAYQQLRADALVLMSEHLLATLDQGVVSLTGGDKYQVMIHIDANSIDRDETLNGEGDKTHCYLDGGPFICPDTVRRLACDAGIVTVLENSDGNILNIGRKSRAVPSPVRRALNLRDQGCRFPACTESRHVEAHHIEHWCAVARPVSIISCCSAATITVCCMRGTIACLWMTISDCYS